jgi:DNA-binding transcriptional LysR family regulator
MELRTLRYFVAIADLGGVTKAAEVVRVAQPSLSRQLRALEREFGTALFERHPGRLQLSSAGSELLPIARDLLAQADALASTARTLAAGGLRHLRIAAPPTTVADVVAPFIATFGRADPQPSVSSVPSGDVYELLQAGAADVVLSPRPPGRRVRSEVVADFPIWLYVAPDDPRTRRRKIHIASLQAERLLLLPPSFVQRRLFEAAATQAGLALDGAREVTSPDVAQALCAAGWGDAVVSDDHRFGIHGLKIETSEGALTMPVHAAWSPRHIASDQIVGIVNRLTDFCKLRYPR